jgi:1D-myo-inositol-tetrakisphosphate 5-kinase/inositol-polyphosphate multikinase
LYTHPSILDVKLGTILYAPDAKEEKKARMEKQAKTSTTWETGLRLTGCQVSSCTFI